MDQARLMSYGADWRLLEERVDDNLSLSAWTEGTWSPGTDLDRVQQYVWGTRYVDDIVLHRVDANIDGDYSDAVDNAWHHLTDAQFSSVCLVDKAFNVAERVSYSAYGVARHLPMADINCDGAVNGADIGALFGAFGSIGSSPYQSPADLNRDGVVNSADLAMLLGDFQAAQPDGALSRPNVDNPIGWDGYVFDRESGLYTVRFRTYETGLGRWMERDPAGYIDGTALYQYVRSSPSCSSDPFGLAEVCGPRVWMFTGEWCTDERIWEAAYEEGSEVVHDMAQGYGDAMGVEDLLKTGHTFDPRDRARGKCYARCLFWGTVEKVLLSELKSAALSGTMGLTGSVADFLTEFSVCDMAIESATFDFKKLLDVPGLVEDISGAFEKYAKRQLEIGFEQRIKRRDPLRAPGQSLAKARREARVAMKDFANQMGKLKEGFGLLSEGIKWADKPWEMSKVIDKCYSECADNPCQSPCAIIKKIN